jgi:cytoskeletal protein CcmA (bactofilin family)
VENVGFCRFLAGKGAILHGKIPSPGQARQGEIRLPSAPCSAEFSGIMANATNVLASGIEINGTIRFSNDMIIDGKIEGEIISEKGRVTIGENAMIKGNVTAGDVKVFGKVEGKIIGERCELKAKSRLEGDIKAKMFSMEEGAQLSGRTEIG